jgi:hypothetical protein
VIIILFLSTSNLSTVIGQPAQDPSIVSINHQPQIVSINETVDFIVNIQNPGLHIINNVTLIIEYENFTQRLMMIRDNNTFNYSRSFSNPGIVLYKAELFSEGELTHTSESISFNVNGLNIPIDLEINKPVAIPKGNSTIRADNGKIEIDLQLNNSIQLTIDLLIAELYIIPENQTRISNIYDIKINNTNALENAVLKIQYDIEIIEDIKLSPEKLNLFTRANNSDRWLMYESQIDEKNNMLTAEVEHFSQWIITTNSSKIRFVEFHSEINVTSKEEFSVMLNVKNQGTYTIQNITISITTTPSILVNNLSKTFNLGDIDALSVKTVTWLLETLEIGEYNIVLTVYNNGKLDEIQYLSIISQNEDKSIETEDKENNRGILNFYFTNWLILIPIILVLIIKKRNNGRYF